MMNDKSDDTFKGEFLLKQYESLRTEITNHMNELGNLAIFATLGTGASWYFFAKDLESQIKSLPTILLLPLIAAVLFACRAASIYLSIYRIADFIRGLEQSRYLLLDEKTGWETRTKMDRDKKDRPLFYWSVLFWLGVIVVNIVIPKALAPSNYSWCEHISLVVGIIIAPTLLLLYFAFKNKTG